MRSYLPIFLLIGGILIASLVGFVIFNLRSQEKTTLLEENEVVQAKIPLPYITLTPDNLGRELSLSVVKIDSSVSTLEYELVYNTAAGVLQGVPGSVSVQGQNNISRTLTLGTCSSGVCRYDKGIRDITLTIRLRDKNGKLLAKFASGVTLSTKEKELASSDGKFKLTLDKTGTGFYTVLETGGVPTNAPGEVAAGPYGVFTSSDEKQSGQVSLPGGSIYILESGKWQQLVNSKVKILGTFVGIK